MSEASRMLKELGEPVVKLAFQDLLSSRITSKKARVILRRFSKRWKDYGRTALMILSCKSVGGDPLLVYPAAKAFTLSAGAFDLHDDIIDKSFFKKEKMKKTIMGIYGPEATLLSGDALMIEAFSELYELDKFLSREKFQRVLSTMKDGLFELGSAEMDELALIGDLDVTPRKYLRIVYMKAADVESYTKVGAIIGGGSEEEIDLLGKYGRLLGMIMILRDDIEDTFNDKVEIVSRIIKESLPLPLVYALTDPKCKLIVQKIIASQKSEDIDELVSIIEKKQGFEKTKYVIEGYIKEAKKVAMKLNDPKPFLSIFSK